MSDKTNVVTEETGLEPRNLNDVADKIAAIITELADEISTTKSKWVKIRNTAEIAILTAALTELKKVFEDLIGEDI